MRKTADLLLLGEPSVAVRDGAVVAAGPRDRLEGLDAAEAIDLGASRILPGLRDAHAHLVQTGLARQRVDLHGMDLGTARRAIATRAAKTPPGGWVQGTGFSIPALGAGREPNAADLDDLVPDHPVRIASHDLHALWLNTLALEKAGRAADEASYVTEDEVRLFLDATGRETAEERLLAAREVQADLHAAGITSVQEHGRYRDLLALSALATEGELRLRIRFSVRDHELPRYLEERDGLALPADRLAVNGQKMFLDGAFTSMTAWTLEPYEGTDTSGHRALERDAAEERVRFAASHGLPTFCHAIGDAAVREALDLFALAPGLPHRVEHAQLVHPDDLPRFAALGVMASVQPVHLLSDAHGLPGLWGEERAARCFPVRTLLELGAEVRLGSDTPVETFDVMKGVWSAVTRRTLDGVRLPGEETVSAETALSLYLSFPRIEPGCPADLTAFPRDPATSAPEELLALAPVLTVFDGAVVHRAI